MNSPISIIVPVYNVEEYLDRCIESIVNQTYKYLEIILVDDGSTDNSGTICDEWKEKDNRIVVIHKENGGQADARNVDSDDFIAENMYAELLKLAEERNANVVGCSNITFSEKDYIVFESEANSREIIEFSQHDAIYDLICERHFKSTVWNLLVVSVIAKSVLFDAGRIHEDVLWPFRVFLQSQKFVYTSKCLYAYFQRSGSIMNRKYSEKRFDALDALEIRASTVKDVYHDLYHLATRTYLGACMYHYQSLCRQPKTAEYQEYKRILHQRFCNGDQSALLDGLGIKYKIWYSLFKAAPELTCRTRNMLKIGL